MRILIITDAFPYPLISGDRIRLYNLIRRVAEQHEVSLAALVERPDELEGVSHFEDFCARVIVTKEQRRYPLLHLPGLLHYALAGKPLELKFKYYEELARKIRHLVSTESFDIVEVEHSHMALYLEALPLNAHCKRILMFHNITFHQYERIAQFESKPMRKIRAWLHSVMMRRWEPRYAERFDRCITVSEEDRRILTEANPRLQIDLVPNGVDTQLYNPLPEEASPALLFIGKMSYAPCVDAVLYFCSEILPRIQRMNSEVEMWVVGRDPLPEIMQLNGDGVHVTGRVDSVVPYYKRSTVCVVPLRSGGGTRLKILEAMALGRPVVSTSIGCEGLDVVDGEHLLIADSPEQFAEKTRRLLEDDSLRERITANARQLVVTRYDWDVIAGQLMQIYAEVRKQ